MNDQSTTNGAMTRRQLRAVAYDLARIYLEVERGLRSPRHMAGFLTSTEYRRHRLTPRAKLGDAKPVRPHDIGRVRLDATTPRRVNASVSVRNGEDSWSALVIDLKRVATGWQVERLDRLERLLPSEPREVEIDENALEERVRLLDDEQRFARAAYRAAERRYDHSDDKRTLSARTLRRDRDSWSGLVERLTSELDELTEQQRLRLRCEFGPTQDVGQARLTRAGELEHALGPRPHDERMGRVWDGAVEAVAAYAERWDVSAERGLLASADSYEQETDRRQLLRRLAAPARGLASPPEISPRQQQVVHERTVDPLTR